MYNQEFVCGIAVFWGGGGVGVGVRRVVVVGGGGGGRGGQFLKKVCTSIDFADNICKYKEQQR